MKVKWCFADAIALALDKKTENPRLDFSKLVNQIWAEMEKENDTE